jgi:ribonuclease P protein component
MRFLPQQHLRKAADFQRIRNSGVRRECGFFYAWMEIEPAGPPLRRAAFIASRRLGPAVDRNRAKRRLRELFRLHQTALPERCSLMLIARRAILNAPFAELEKRFLRSLGGTAS